MNSIEPKITISQKIEGNNLIMASSSTWSGNSNFLMKSQNSSKGVSKKKNVLNFFSKWRLQVHLTSIQKERYVNLPFADNIGKGKGKKRLAIFDLDETLIHCELNQENEAQTNIEVVLPNKKTKTIGLNMRPHWKEEMLKIKEKYYNIYSVSSIICGLSFKHIRSTKGNF